MSDPGGFSAVIISLIIFYFLPVAFSIRLRNHVAIQSRMLPLLILYAAVTFVASLNTIFTFQEFDDLVSYTCLGRIIINNMFIVFGLYSLLLRALYLVCQNTVQRARMNLSSQFEVASLSFIEKVAIFIYAKKERRKSGKSSIFASSKKVLDAPSSISKSGVSVDEKSMAPKDIIYMPTSMSTRTVMKWACYIFLLEGVFCGVNIFVSYKYLFLRECPFDAIWVSNGHRLAVAFATLCVLFHLRKINDSLHIQKELMTSLIVTLFFLVLYLVANYSPSDSPLRGPGTSMYSLLGYIFTNFYTCIFPLLRLMFVKKSNLQANIEALEQALKDPDSFQELKQLAIEDFSVENILFCQQYSRLLKLDPESNAKTVHNIYQNFVVTDAPYELNLPSAVKKAVIQRQDKEGLDKIAKEVYNMILTNTFRRYIAKHQKGQV
ncbi:hypothetical protein ROZALSC1DRAFT_20088 [Rozella allomycis CSF55]|uniref:RGS domain-containing protein n=1 Tax=Rozella allomycis (strain CSF55) TaxID=988480 RepID=A0A4P9YS53_ROZAC|nr:hypothetical protein ROZALSC1DRAFT_20088 [Rozella allomycis CSF55]